MLSSWRYVLTGYCLPVLMMPLSSLLTLSCRHSMSKKLETVVPIPRVPLE
jgi:hypothetical protein